MMKRMIQEHLDGKGVEFCTSAAKHDYSTESTGRVEKSKGKTVT